MLPRKTLWLSGFSAWVGLSRQRRTQPQCGLGEGRGKWEGCGAAGVGHWWRWALASLGWASQGLSICSELLSEPSMAFVPFRGKGVLGLSRLEGKKTRATRESQGGGKRRSTKGIDMEREERGQMWEEGGVGKERRREGEAGRQAGRRKRFGPYTCGLLGNGKAAWLGSPSTDRGPSGSSWYMLSSFS